MRDYKSYHRMQDDEDKALGLLYQDAHRHRLRKGQRRFRWDIICAGVCFISLVYFIASSFLFKRHAWSSKPAHDIEEDPFGPNVPSGFGPDEAAKMAATLDTGHLPKAPILRNGDGSQVEPSHKVSKTNSTRLANAAIVILCRNSDLNDMRRTLRQFEDRFNRRYHYPYIFFNNEPFTEEFKSYIRAATTSRVEFHAVANESWSYPPWINTTMADERRATMEKQGVIYGGSLSYRHMCRWYSGWFYRHPALSSYKWYWRVEPGVSFFCDIPYDPFVYMEENKKKYGFVISLLEIMDTVPTLWNSTRDFALENKITTSPFLEFFTDDQQVYNGCHFWSNFEVAELDLWRGPLYSKYFDYLDKKGGFFYERWGDAPVHSVFLGLALQKDQIHFFNDIGYQHEHLAHCDDTGELAFTCQCPRKTPNFDFKVGSCLRKWLDYKDTTWGFGQNVTRKPVQKSA